jgi:SsrA-binding protein
VAESKSRPKKTIATNRKARHVYEVMETIEAGLVLTGTEVKSLRAGKATVAEAYAVHRDGDFFLQNHHINPYEQGNRANHEPLRARKLLLHRHEIDYLRGKVEAKGFTVVPLELYFSGSYVKVTLALVRGKKVHDRRQDIAKRDAQREIQRAVRLRDR